MNTSATHRQGWRAWQRSYLRPIERLCRNALRSTIRRFGYEVVCRRAGKLGIDAFQDMKALLAPSDAPIVLDVGANRGQSIEAFKRTLPMARVHAFEPAAATFRQLTERARSYSGIVTNQVAVGATCGQACLVENSHSKMTSLLEPGSACWGEVVDRYQVPMQTLDSYCKAADLPHVHILKSDTQGFDFEVFKGASSLLAEGRVQMIYSEFIFSDMYRGLPPFDEVYRYLLDHGFRLVSFYRFAHHDRLASWSDALFLNPDFRVTVAR